MKRAKSAKPFIVRTYTVSTYGVECPHCKTVLSGNWIREDYLVILCSHCHNPIKFIWEEGRVD